MSVVNEKVQSVKHLFVVSHQRHLQVLVNHFPKLRFSFILLVNQLDLSLLLRLLQQKVSVPDYLVRLFHNFVDVCGFRQELRVLLLVILSTLLREELLAHIGPLV